MKIKIGFFAVMLALALLMDHSLFSLSTFLAALLHELGHILMALLCKIRLKECKVGLYGAGLMPDNGLYSYKKEILLCLAGPMTNLLCALGCFLFVDIAVPGFLSWFMFSSISLGTLNLLPIKGFDGGRVLHALICQHDSPVTARIVLEICSFLCVFLLWSFSVYLLLRATASLSLFVFAISLFGKIFIADKE